MKTKVLPAFRMSFDSVDGRYQTIFQSKDEWDGTIDVIISEVGMRWDVVIAQQDEDGRVSLGGSP